MAKAKSIGWAIYVAGFVIWLFGYLSTGHAAAFDWNVAAPSWISSFERWFWPDQQHIRRCRQRLARRLRGSRLLEAEVFCLFTSNRNATCLHLHNLRDRTHSLAFGSHRFHVPP